MVTKRKSRSGEKKNIKKICPVGSWSPCLYGIPKIYKQRISLRPILSVVSSGQLSIAKWLADILKPVLQLHSKNCFSDSFTFADQIRNISIDPNNLFFWCFDIVSLYKNDPLSETLVDFADTLQRIHLDLLLFQKLFFQKLIHIAFKGVQFTFYNTMYQQTS